MAEECDLDYVNRMIEQHGISDDFFLALGWAVGKCCEMLDRGEDPRRVGVPDLMTQAIRDIYDDGEGDDEA